LIEISGLNKPNLGYFDYWEKSTMKLPLATQTPASLRLGRGKPPSSDGVGQRYQHLRTKVERPRSQPLGRKSSPIELTEIVDELVVHSICECQKCGTGLQQVAVKEWQLSQVHEVSPRLVRVIEHQAQVKTCPQCGAVNQAEFAAGVNNRIQQGKRLQGSQYGERLQRLMVHLVAA
jgi:hypothetical protein